MKLTINELNFKVENEKQDYLNYKQKINRQKARLQEAEEEETQLRMEFERKKNELLNKILDKDERIRKLTKKCQSLEEQRRSGSTVPSRSGK